MLQLSSNSSLGLSHLFTGLIKIIEEVQLVVLIILQNFLWQNAICLSLVWHAMGAIYWV